MKRTLIAIFATVILSAHISFAHAMMEPIVKLKNGVVELITSPIGFATETSALVDESQNKLFGFFAGLISGTDYLITHSISGLVDILTFPVPDDY